MAGREPDFPVYLPESTAGAPVAETPAPSPADAQGPGQVPPIVINNVIDGSHLRNDRRRLGVMGKVGNVIWQHKKVSLPGLALLAALAGLGADLAFNVHRHVSVQERDQATLKSLVPMGDVEFQEGTGQINDSFTLREPVSGLTHTVESITGDLSKFQVSVGRQGSIGMFIHNPDSGTPNIRLSPYLAKWETNKNGQRIPVYGTEGTFVVTPETVRLRRLDTGCYRGEDGKQPCQAKIGNSEIDTIKKGVQLGLVVLPIPVVGKVIALGADALLNQALGGHLNKAALEQAAADVADMRLQNGCGDEVMAKKANVVNGLTFLVKALVIADQERTSRFAGQADRARFDDQSLNLPIPIKLIKSDGTEITSNTIAVGSSASHDYATTFAAEAGSGIKAKAVTFTSPEVPCFVQDPSILNSMGRKAMATAGKAPLSGSSAG